MQLADVLPERDRAALAGDLDRTRGEDAFAHGARLVPRRYLHARNDARARILFEDPSSRVGVEVEADLGNRPTEELLARPPEELHEGVVDVDDDPVAVPRDDDAGGGRAENRRDVTFAGGRFDFRALTLRHVVREPEKEAAPAEVEGSEADLAREGRTVLAAVVTADHMWLTGDDARPQLLGRGEVEVRLDVGDGERKELLARVAEGLAGASVHVDEAPVAVVNEHRVGRLIDQRA